MQASYDAAAAVLADLRASAAARKAADEAAAVAEKQRADEDFQQQHTELSKQVRSHEISESSCNRMCHMPLAGGVAGDGICRQTHRYRYLPSSSWCGGVRVNPAAWTNP